VTSSFGRRAWRRIRFGVSSQPTATTTSTIHASPAQSGNVAVVLQYVPGVSARLPSIDRPALTAVECSGTGGQSRACDLQVADDTLGWCSAIGQTDTRRPHGQSFIPLRLGIPTLFVLAELSFPW
jgi:hypothetical protein